MACLSEDAVLEFVEGRAAPTVVAEVDVHLASCPACRSVVADVADGLSRPMKLGRYEVVRTLGVGGMGVVYEAHDPHLHRRVALKVMRADHTMSDDAQARALREARAMAQVSHPNVVTVHDVGVVERQIFIAMEYVDGSTLKAFMRGRPPWRLVLEHLLQAGEGLAAAHDVGLVHRDFKPENVLLGKDGRVRVTDFGLARLASAPEEAVPSARRKGQDVLTTLTRTNLFVGTPAYMAPEQFAGKLADPRSDQFSFSVVLYEAIYGVRPFKGSSLQELTASALTADVSGAMPRSDEPAALRAALAKGLERDPSKRHETMRDLLAALRASSNVRPRRARWLYAALGAGVLLPVIVFVPRTLWPKALPAAADPTSRAAVSAPMTDPLPIDTLVGGTVGSVPSGAAVGSVAGAQRAPSHLRNPPRPPHALGSARSALKPFDEDKR